MSPNYREQVLSSIEAGQGGFRTAGPSASQPIFDDPLASIGDYRAILGREVCSRPVRAEKDSVLHGTTAHCFLLRVWPHLFWVVHEQPNGFCTEIGFQNQFRIRFENFDPALVQPGLWTKPSLEDAADHFEPTDGWGDRLVASLRFGNNVYQGTFTFGLLDHWERTPEEGS